MSWKKKALELLTLRVELMRQIPGTLSDYCQLPEGYVLDAATSQSICECKTKLRRQRLEIQSPHGILLGEPHVHHHIKQCPNCRRVYRCERLGKLVPPHGNYAFDLIVEAGLARFLRQRQNDEIRQDLKKRFRISVPCTTISHLANTFLDCFAAVHYANADRIKALINADGGYTLHLDGTCEAGTDTIFAAIDGRTELVLASARMSAENLADISELLRRCVKMFGQPISVMRDLSRNIGLAIQAELPDVIDFVCHYHFLENVGKRLCENPLNTLTKLFRKLKIRLALTSMRRKLVEGSKKRTPLSEKQILEFLETPEQVLDLDAVQLRRYLSYLLLRWLDDYGADMKGEYFPFDLATLTLHRRCVKLYTLIKGLLNNHELKPSQFRTVQTMMEKLAPVRKDQELVAAVSRLEKAEKLFNRLRSVLRFNISNKKPLLRQTAPHSTLQSALLIESQLDAFRSELECIVNEHTDTDECADAKVVLHYLDKYRNQLFGHAISVEGRTEPILVPRTNNVSEHCFAHAKQQLRRKLGFKKLTRYVQAMRPEELLVGNLKSQPYIDTLYGGTLDNMAAVFAKHWQEGNNIRRQRLQRLSSHPMPLSKKQLRDENLLSRIETGMNVLIGAALRSRPAA